MVEGNSLKHLNEVYSVGVIHEETDMGHGKADYHEQIMKQVIPDSGFLVKVSADELAISKHFDGFDKLTLRRKNCGLKVTVSSMVISCM
jgi:hypothetical protein